MLWPCQSHTWLGLSLVIAVWRTSSCSLYLAGNNFFLAISLQFQGWTNQGKWSVNWGFISELKRFWKGFFNWFILIYSLNEGYPASSELQQLKLYEQELHYICEMMPYRVDTAKMCQLDFQAIITLPCLTLMRCSNASFTTLCTSSSDEKCRSSFASNERLANRTHFSTGRQSRLTHSYAFEERRLGARIGIDHYSEQEFFHRQCSLVPDIVWRSAEFNIRTVSNSMVKLSTSGRMRSP